MVIRGPELCLRYARAADAAALLELGSDPDVTRFFSWGPYEELSQPLRYIESLAAQRAAGTRLEFVIVDRDDQPVGVTGLSEFSLRDRRAVVGSWLGKRHWGTGVNAESKALVLSLAFRRLELLRVTAWASPDNGRSMAALERVGFEMEGVLRGWHVHHGAPQDCAVLRLMADDFERSPLARVPVEIEGEPLAQFVAAQPAYSQRK